MEGNRLETPQPVFQPEGRIDQRPVVAFVFEGGRREPEVRQAGGFVHRRRFGEGGVVPEEIAGDRGEVRDDGEQAQQESGEDGAAPVRVGALPVAGVGRARGRRAGIAVGSRRRARSARVAPVPAVAPALSRSFRGGHQRGSGRDPRRRVRAPGERADPPSRRSFESPERSRSLRRHRENRSRSLVDAGAARGRRVSLRFRRSRRRLPGRSGVIGRALRGGGAAAGRFRGTGRDRRTPRR